MIIVGERYIVIVENIARVIKYKVYCADSCFWLRNTFTRKRTVKNKTNPTSNKLNGAITCIACLSRYNCTTVQIKSTVAITRMVKASHLLIGNRIEKFFCIVINIICDTGTGFCHGLLRSLEIAIVWRGDGILCSCASKTRIFFRYAVIFLFSP